jgi:hypothetical protein
VSAARTALSLAYVSAFSFNIPWKLIEPADGQYDWTLIDAAASIAAGRHKKISVGIGVDGQAPDWVRKGSASYTFRDPDLGLLTSPVPWDPFYIKKLDAAVAALGQRYNGNPAILFVVVTGPSTYWGTETNWTMISDSMSSRDLNVLDFTLNKYEHGWRRMIEDYFRAFPDTALALALSDQIAVPDYPGVPHDLYEGVATVRRIRDFALAKERSLKPGQKLWLGLRGLSKGGDGNYLGPYDGPGSITPYESLVWDMRDKAHILYQDAGGMRARHYAVADVAAELAIGISFAADAIEVDTSDLFDNEGEVWEPYRKTIAAAHAKLAAGRAEIPTN